MLPKQLKDSQRHQRQPKQVELFFAEWATIKIMKTLLKNQSSYQTHIGLLDVMDSDIKSEDKREDDEWEKMYMNDNAGNKEENSSSVNGDEEEDGEEEEEEESEGKDDGDDKKEEEEEEEIEAKKSNGEGRSGAEKRKATQDDQPMATTRSKRIKVSDSKDH